MARLSQTALVAGLGEIVGAEHVSTGTAQRVAYSADFWPRAQIWKMGGDVDRYPPDCVVWPADEDEVAAVLRFCNEHRVPVIPYGAGSGVCGGTVPVHGGVVVDVKRMQRLIAIDRTSLTVTAQAGINGQHLEDRVNAHGATLGHFPSSIMCSTLGGWLAARSAGQYSSRYGKIEDMVTSLRVVLADGTILDTRDRTPGAPDWTQLIVGSEGTLGVITSAQLKVHPLPESRVFRGWRFRQVSEGLTAMRQVMQAGLRPAVLRLYDPFDSFIALGGDHGEADTQDPGPLDGLRALFDSSAPARDRAAKVLQPLRPLGGLARRAKRAALGAVLNAPGTLNAALGALPTACLLIIGFEGPRETVRADMWRAGRILAEAGGSDAGAAVGQAWDDHRYDVSFKQAKLYEVGAFLDTMEVASTWDRLYPMYVGVRRALAPHALIMAHFSHAYRDGCSIYFTFAGHRRDSRRAERLHAKIWDVGPRAVHAAGGTAAHHHGVGLAKRDAMVEEHGDMLRVWRALKETFDPRHIMNPGKLFPDAEELPGGDDDALGSLGGSA